MTGLLVSVRNTAEAEAALLGGADIIDVKEPQHGALGAAALETIWEVFEFVDGRLPVSAACGELCDELNFPLSALPPLAFAKVGLAGCAPVANWRHRLLSWWSELPPASKGVAVAYANWKEALAVAPDEVLEFCIDQGGRHLLFDTTNKSRSLMSYVRTEQVECWKRLARQHEIQVVVAGSLQKEHLHSVVPLWRPTYVGVRGAVCESDRLSRISQDCVSEFCRVLRQVPVLEGDDQWKALDFEKGSKAEEIS